MAYGSEALTAAETAGFAADKPMMVVQQADTASEANWTTTGDLAGSGDSQTDGKFPATRAYDDLGSILTKFRSEAPYAAASPKYFNFEFSSAITFDTLLILDHNFNSGGFTSVALEINENEDWSGTVLEIAKYTVSGTTDNRILITNLNHEGGSNTYSAGGTAKRYTDIPYARLKIVHSGSRTPEVGEIILGYRYQLPRNPDLPWNNKNEVSSVSDFVSSSGVTKRYVFNRGQGVRAFSAMYDTAADITLIDNWFNAIEEGTRPFVYIETPSSAPDARLMLQQEAGLSFGLTGPSSRQLSMQMIEQQPFLSRE